MKKFPYQIHVWIGLIWLFVGIFFQTGWEAALWIVAGVIFLSIGFAGMKRR